VALRIVGGRLSGRRFRGPGKRTRPTAERVREAMFSALVARDAVSDARVLDLFSGTGALAFEALSRGATSAVAVDDDRRAASAIRTDAEVLGLTSELDVVVLDLLRAPKKAAERLARRGPFDLILADPPYADAQRAIGLLEALAKAGGVAPDALVVLEHASADELSLGARLASVASYRYGSTAVAFLTAVELEAR
jgi:16S rRNA (guanine966-N2)-methyltransferase